MNTISTATGRNNKSSQNRYSSKLKSRYSPDHGKSADNRKQSKSGHSAIGLSNDGYTNQIQIHNMSDEGSLESLTNINVNVNKSFKSMHKNKSISKDLVQRVKAPAQKGVQ